jgi:hypothetical protein
MFVLMWCASTWSRTDDWVSTTILRLQQCFSVKDCCTYSLLHAQQNALTHNNDDWVLVLHFQPLGRNLFKRSFSKTLDTVGKRLICQ